MLTRTILTVTVLTSVLMLNAPNSYAAKKGVANIASRSGRSLGSGSGSNGLKGNTLGNRSGTFRSLNGNGSNNALSSNNGLGNRLNNVGSGNGNNFKKQIVGNNGSGFSGVGSNPGTGFSGVGSNPGSFSGKGSNPTGGFSGVGSNPTAGIPTGKNSGNGNGYHNFGNGHHNFGFGHHGFGFGHGFFGHGFFPHGHFGFGKGLFIAGLALSAANGQATFTAPVSSVAPAISVVAVNSISPTPVSDSETPIVDVDLTPLVWTLSSSVVTAY